MLFSYARVSTADQNLDLQHAALKAASCTKIFEDRITGTARQTLRPGARAQGVRRRRRAGGGSERLGRSLGHLIELLTGLAARGVQIRSLTEHLDTTTPTGKLTFHVVGALAEFEHTIIVERTSAGLKAAKARGVQLGRKPSLTTVQTKHARKLIDAGEDPRAVARSLGVDRSTLYRHFARLTD